MNPNENNSNPNLKPDEDQSIVPINQPQQPVSTPVASPVAPVSPLAPVTPSPAATADPIDINTPASQPISSPSPFDSAYSTNNTGSSNSPQQVSPSEDPGKTLGVVGFILSLLGFGIISLIISIIGRNKSKKAGHSNGFALAGIIISIITIIISIVATILLISGGMKAAEYCKENGTTIQNTDGSTSYNCSAGTDTSSGNGSTGDSSTMQFDTVPEGSGSMEPGIMPGSSPTAQ